MRQSLSRLFLTAALSIILSTGSAPTARAQVTFGNFAPGTTISATNDGSLVTGGLVNWGVAFTTNASTQTPITDLQLALSVFSNGITGTHVFITSTNVDNATGAVLNFTATSAPTTTPQAIDFTPNTVFTPSPSTTYYLHVDSTNQSNLQWNFVDDSPPTLSNYYHYSYGSVQSSFLSADRGGYYLVETAVVPEAAQTGLIIGVGALGAGLMVRRYRKRDTVKVQG